MIPALLIMSAMTFDTSVATRSIACRDETTILELVEMRDQLSRDEYIREATDALDDGGCLWLDRGQTVAVEKRREVTVCVVTIPGFPCRWTDTSALPD